MDEPVDAKQFKVRALTGIAQMGHEYIHRGETFECSPERAYTLLESGAVEVLDASSDPSWKAPPPPGSAALLDPVQPRPGLQLPPSTPQSQSTTPGKSPRTPADSMRPITAGGVITSQRLETPGSQASSGPATAAPPETTDSTASTANKPPVSQKPKAPSKRAAK